MNYITQEKIIVDYCRKNIWITQLDAFRLGIGRLASRIWDMEEKGYVIIRERVKVTKADGTTAYVKRYSIIRTPEGEKINELGNAQM